jgi:hypothetical protein
VNRFGDGSRQQNEKFQNFEKCRRERGRGNGSGDSEPEEGTTKPENGEGERSIAVGAPALQLSTAPHLFLPTRSTLLLPALERMCSHRYPTRRPKIEQMARADTKGHFVTLIVRARTRYKRAGCGHVPFRNDFVDCGTTMQTFAHFFLWHFPKVRKSV